MSQETCPLPVLSLPSSTVSTVAPTKRMTAKLTVCLLSPHPLVLSEFERLLAKANHFKVIPKQLESTLAPDLRSLEPPKAQV